MTHTKQVLSDERVAEVLTTSYGSPEWTMDDARAARAIESATLKTVSGQEPLPEGWRLIAVNAEFDNLMYWMDRCESKGHLENCYDLVEPWAAFQYLEHTPPAQPAPVDERETRAQKHERNWRVQSRYNELMRDGYRGHYEAMFRVVQEEVEAARAALQCAQAPQAGGWQPIETAPKDGTAVLVAPGLWTGRGCSTATYNPDKYAKKPRPYWERDDAFGKVMYSRDNPPTHWQPLPPAPQPTKGQP